MIKLENVIKSFKGKQIIKGISLEVGEGELVVLIGPSGCGKTTILKMINRLIPFTKGNIMVNNENITEVDPIELRRNIGYTIQKIGLFPHMTVRENIEIISKIQGQSDEEIEERTLRLMDMVGLKPNEFLDRYPNELSGGQQQRVGVARAFACDSGIVLMDEPFSALDPLTRMQLQDELVALHKTLNKTVIFVTLDMDEAIRISDKICIINQGKIIQYDETEKILKYPKDDYVKKFVGEHRIWSTPQFIKVKDIMITEPLMTKQNMSIDYCIKQMKEHNVDNLLIVDDNQKLIGTLSFRTISNVSDQSAKIIDLCERTFTSVSPNNSIIKIMKLFYEKNLNDIPVIDNNKKLCGLITSNSLVNKLSRQYIDLDNLNNSNSTTIGVH